MDAMLTIFALTGFCPLSIMLYLLAARELCKCWFQVHRDRFERSSTMPFYEYKCEACKKDFVLLQSLTAKAEDTACPHCDEKKARKLVSRFSSLGGDGHVCNTGGRSWGGG
jgi:putative FmdB family regulatory protein